MTFHKIIRIAEQPARADKSAPTDGRINLFICKIGGGRDTSAPTESRINLFI